MIELTPLLNEKSNIPLYIQLYQYIREEIVSGRIKQDTRLPSIRNLSVYLKISRTPIADAYELLLEEGYIRSKPRSGFYAVSPETISVLQTEASREPKEENPKNQIASFDFHYDHVDLYHFPFKKWKKWSSLCLTSENLHLLQKNANLQGEYGLRKEVASYLHQVRGVCCSPDQIIISAGTYHSLQLLFHLLKDDVKIVGTEEAVNIGVKAIFEQYSSFSYRSITLESDGISMEDLYNSQAQAVYVTPSHQFPFGMTFSIKKRMELLQWAYEKNAYIIENDYDSEFRFNGRPLPALQSLDKHDRVIYIGTFSRILSPSFRISYLILPRSLFHRFQQQTHSYNQIVSPILQKTLQLFMESNDFARHMRKMRHLYQKKHDILVDAVNYFFKDQADISGQGSGLHILLKVKNGMTENELILAAKKEGINVYPSSIYHLESSSASSAAVLLGFGALSEETIKQGIKKLAKAWRIKQI
ncbi:PLP-dependent aminotransferase family protein [Bacillus subtilis]|nr:PLP-dependent aminotransferase family protein [Bacillus subtilis]